MKKLHGIALWVFFPKPFSLYSTQWLISTIFTPRKASVCQVHLPNWYPFASLLFREYSLTLFRAHIETIKMLQGSIHLVKTPFFVVFRNFNDYYRHKASVGEVHLPNSYFLQFFRPENTAQNFSEPRSMVQASVPLLRTSVFRLFSRFQRFSLILDRYRRGTPT